jgi:alpha-2-macroglobulin
MPRKIVPALIALLCLVFFAAQRAAAQDEQFPPSIIDVFPIDDIAPNTPLTITFDQAMDKASVIGALNFEPQLYGRYSWVDDRTLAFLPDSGWSIGQRFAVDVDTTAKATNGLTLEVPYAFDVNSIGALEVAQVQPSENSTEVAVDSRIVVSFNRPVIALGSESTAATPITIEPAIEGVGRWINTSMYAFEPTTIYNGATSYTVRVAAGLTSADGASLQNEFAWSFTTAAPDVVGVRLGEGGNQELPEYRVPLLGPIAVTFNQPMDRASVEAAFSVAADAGQTIATGTFAWSDDSTIVTFTPNAVLRRNTAYRLTVAATALSASGGAMAEPYTDSFITLPDAALVSISPEDGAVLPSLYGISLQFATPMDNNSLQGRIVISPTPPELEISVPEWNLFSAFINFQGVRNTKYTLTMLPGIQDIYGGTINETRTFSFTVGLVNSAYPVVNGDLMLTDANNPNTSINMMVSGTAQATFELYTLRIEQLVQLGITSAFTHPSPKYYNGNLPEMPEALAGNERIRTWTTPFNSPTQERIAVPLVSDIGGQLNPGLYWLRVTVGEKTYQFALAVATANIVVKRTQGETLIWVTDFETGQPVQNADVTMFANGEVIAEGQTDADGIFSTPTNTGGRQVTVEVSGTAVFGAWYSTREPQLPDDAGYLYTDRPMYRPGETVRFRGVLRNRSDMSYDIPELDTVTVLVGENYGVFDGNEVFRLELPLTEFGTFSGEYVIPTDARLGLYSLQLGEGFPQQHNALITFSVSQFRVPEFEVTTTIAQDTIVQGDALNAQTLASYYFGGAVGNTYVAWRASAEKATFQPRNVDDYSFFNERTDDTREFPGAAYSFPVGGTDTDAQGRSLLQISDTRVPFVSPILITVESTISDGGSQAVAARATVFAHPATVYAGVKAEPRFVRRGEPTMLETLTISPEGDILPGQTVNIEIQRLEWQRVEGQSQSRGFANWEEVVVWSGRDVLTTNEQGKAGYRFTPPQAGIYRLTADVRDAQGRLSRSTLRFYAAGSEQTLYTPPTNGVGMCREIPPKS